MDDIIEIRKTRASNSKSYTGYTTPLIGMSLHIGKFFFYKIVSNILQLEFGIYGVMFYINRTEKSVLISPEVIIEGTYVPILADTHRPYYRYTNKQLSTIICKTLGIDPEEKKMIYFQVSEESDGKGRFKLERV